jgi:DNA topoisomerase-1
VKNAQEAHEAIRPAGDTFATPDAVRSELDSDEFRLYELIWQRTVASQMADARGTTLSLRISGRPDPASEVTFAASGRTITFAGFLKAYVETVDELAGGEADDEERRLPNLTQGQRVTANDLTPRALDQPAGPLHRGLADQGARGSRHRPPVDVLVDHQDHPGPRLRVQEGQRDGAVLGRVRRDRPSGTTLLAAGGLRLHRGHGGRARRHRRRPEQRTNWLSNFYFGGEHGVEGSVARAGGLKKLVGANLEDIDARTINSIKLFDDEGRAVNVRVGKNGPYLERMIVDPDDPDGELKPQRANLNDSLTPDELTLELAENLFATPQEGRSLGVDPDTGHEIVAKDGRYGPYVTEVLPEPPEDPDAGRPPRRARSPPGPSRAPVRCCAAWTCRR